MIGATSLRTNNGYNNVTPKNFGKAQAHKNNGASNIAKGVGAVAMTAVGLYMFKGKLASLNFIKPLKNLATGLLQKLKDVKILEKAAGIWNTVKTFVTENLGKLKLSGIIDKAKDFGAGTMEKTAGLFDKAKDICTVVMEKAGKIFDFLKKTAPKPHA